MTTGQTVPGSPTVLHVAESFGGGTQSAILAYSSATPEFHHRAFVRERADSGTGELPSVLEPVVRCDGSLMNFALQARAHIMDVKPDIVHLHSSKAGLVRAVAPSRTRLVYTPHCYGFERTDLSRAAKHSVRLVERLLAGRRQLVAAVGPREAELSRELHSGPVVTVPNSAPTPTSAPHRSFPTHRPAEVVSCGRISPQKDPRLFAQIAQAGDSALRFTWVGGGDPELEDVLRSAGVSVTGWVPRAEAIARVAHADIYLHTAAWESNPFTLLEAAAAGTPVIARDIASLAAMGFFTGGETAADLVSALRTVLDDRNCWTEVSQRSLRVLEENSAERQVQALRNAYDIAMEFG